MVAEAGGRNTRSQYGVVIGQKTPQAGKLSHLRRLEEDAFDLEEFYIAGEEQTRRCSGDVTHRDSPRNRVGT